MVHRGIYEAAKGLYEQVLPLVQAHMAAHGEDARIRFTGHSLGGSLAMLLSLMLCLRKAIPVSALLPVYTFGSPCIMCGGELLLHKLGLPRSHIQSVVMHLDIVPRTFACDYPDHVTVVLKRMNGNFRNLSCLLQQVRVWSMTYPVSNHNLLLLFLPSQFELHWFYSLMLSFFFFHVCLWSMCSDWYMGL
jgi:hypothetical protein